MDLGLANKVALVTASSKGLGRACAEELAKEGARVVICSRHPDELAKAAQEIRAKASAAEIHTVTADVTRADDVSRLVKAAMSRFGQLDILVTNAGGPKAGTFLDLDEDDWSEGLDSTLWPVVRLIRNALPHLARAKERDGGRIINIQSTSVKQPIAGLTLSNAIRPAVIGLSKSLSRELALEAITINTVCPGSFDTDRQTSLQQRKAAETGRSIEEVAADAAKAVPIGRFGRPDELAALVAYLASPRAAYITGQTIAIDGGMVAGIMG